jgi:hypothetical protein
MVRFLLCGILLAGCVQGQVHGELFLPGVESTGLYYVDTKHLRAPSDLSAFACIDDRHCLIGADEGRRVQVATLDRDKRAFAISKSTLLLLPGGKNEIDVEGITAIDDAFYVTGSYSVAKRSGRLQASRHHSFRFTADPESGEPVGEVQTASLTRLLADDPVLGNHLHKPLQRRGLNIEGLAARAGKLYFGLRSPSLLGKAHVIEISPDELFSGKEPKGYSLLTVPLGEGLGIRGMTATREGFLIIAGNAGSEGGEAYGPRKSVDYDSERDFTVHFWDGASRLETIGPLPDAHGKAETVWLLAEDESRIEFLVLFDGPSGGRPTAYVIHRKRSGGGSG